MGKDFVLCLLSNETFMLQLKSTIELFQSQKIDISRAYDNLIKVIDYFDQTDRKIFAKLLVQEVRNITKFFLNFGGYVY